MADITYPLFPILAFLGFVLVLIPLPWHLKAWNSGTCFYMMWASLACLNQFVNSVVWHNNARNPAPFWCEISIRIMMGASVGLPASSLCINRRLYHIITAHSGSITNSEKKRAIMVDTLICVVFPLLYIALQYVVQGHRFNIYEDIGCFPAVYNTLAMYFITMMWPLLIGCISAVYCILTLYTFSRRRIEFTRLLSAHPSITIWRYFRLMALAMTELCCTIPLSAFVIWLNLTAAPLEPWISWADTHFNYSRVDRFPALIWRRNAMLVVSMDFTRWVVPVSAFIFIVFFGFAEEARTNYFAAFMRLRRCGECFQKSRLRTFTSQTKSELCSHSRAVLPLPATCESTEKKTHFTALIDEKVAPSIATDSSGSSDSPTVGSFAPSFDLPKLSNDTMSVRTCPW